MMMFACQLHRPSLARASLSRFRRSGSVYCLTTTVPIRCAQYPRLAGCDVLLRTCVLDASRLIWPHHHPELAVNSLTWTFLTLCHSCPSNNAADLLQQHPPCYNTNSTTGTHIAPVKHSILTGRSAPTRLPTVFEHQKALTKDSPIFRFQSYLHYCTCSIPCFWKKYEFYYWSSAYIPFSRRSKAFGRRKHGQWMAVDHYGLVLPQG
jgi:hypothetical protein